MINSLYRDKGFVAGAQVLIDTNGFSLKKHSYSVGYITKGFEAYGSVTDHKNFEWRFLQSYKNFTIGCMFGWAGNFSRTDFGIASLYKVNDDTFIKARICGNSRVGLAYGFKPTPGEFQYLFHRAGSKQTIVVLISKNNIYMFAIIFLQRPRLLSLWKRPSTKITLLQVADLHLKFRISHFSSV